MKNSSNNNILATIVAFYLSKYNDRALNRLGFRTYTNAFEECGRLLAVKPNYVKFRRDEFDPIFSWRKGWRNRPISKRVASIYAVLDDISESDMYTIVVDILYGREKLDLKLIFESIESQKKDNNKQSKFVPRVITGKLAENFFEENYNSNNTLPKGILKDCRDNGCGYDYEILCDDGIVYFVEVKGIADSNGGILFTSKEWCVASEKGDLYYLCIVRNVNSPTPTIQYILNPAKSLSPTKNIKATIQISYSVSDRELFK